MLGGASCCGISVWAAAKMITTGDAAYGEPAIAYLAMAIVYLISIIVIGKL